MDNQEPSNPFVSIHVPVALVALAISMLFFSQIKGLGTSTETAKWQSTNADKQLVALKDAREKLTKAIADRKPLADQSEGLQKTFTEMMKEVKGLMDKGDEDAKKIIVGYNIQVADNPAAPEARKDK